MSTYKRTETQQKVIEGMNQVYHKLLVYKKQINSELVVLKGNKIVKIKPK